jgi:hypothetical protein
MIAAFAAVALLIGLAPAAAAAEPPGNMIVEPVPPGHTIGILGKKVWGPNGEDMGLIVDVLVDARGRARAAIVDFGGFLGVGSRKVAVDWRLLQVTPGDTPHQVSLGLGRADIQAAPEYKPGGPLVEMIGPPPGMPTAPARDK